MLESKKLDVYIGAYLSNWDVLQERGMRGMMAKSTKDHSHHTAQTELTEASLGDV